MKTSNKLLLFFFLAILATLGLVQATLYARYNRQAWVKWKDPYLSAMKDNHPKQPTHYSSVPPVCILVRGIMQVQLIQADSFALEISEPGKGTQVRANEGFFNAIYERHGDTLLVEGYNAEPVRIMLENEPELYRKLPVVQIYCRNIPNLIMDNTHVTLMGTKKPASSLTKLQLIGTWCGLGQLTYPEAPDSLYYDRVEISAKNSTLKLFPDAQVKELTANLDDHSTLEDNRNEIGKQSIHFTDSTRIICSGHQLKYLNTSHATDH